MSVVERIGKFIIEYQFEVEIALGLLVALILTILIIKAMRNSRKKRELLSQINEKISELSATVNDLESKKSGMIYIDNRSQKDNGKVEVFHQEEPVAAPEPETTHEPEEASEPEETIVLEVTPAIEEASFPEKAEAELDVEKDKEARIKYFENDCRMDKRGKIHTIEELKERIKE